MQRLVRLVGLIIIDALLINISYMLSFLLRFDFVIESTAFTTYFEVYLTFWFVLTLIKLGVFAVFGMYRSLWLFAGGQEAARTVAGVLAANVIAGIVLTLFNGEAQRSLMMLPFVFDLLFIGGIRMFYRFAGGLGHIKLLSSEDGDVKRVMIIGSGYSASAVIKEMKLHAKDIKAVPVIAIDDNRNRVGSLISGIKVAGTRKDIPRLVRRHKIDEIYITLPSGNKKEIESVVNECRKTSCKVKVLPAIYEFIEGKVSVSKFKEMNPDEMFRGERIQINSKKLTECFKGRIVLVTGAGGTIGSELCRRIGEFIPRRIIALDASEKGMFELQMELKSLYPDVDICTAICSVTEPECIKDVFRKNKPHIIVHAASHKNVQLMEENPKEAITNNLLGTETLINACEEFAAEKFIYISSDKAVRPAGVTGAVTRACEILVKIRAQSSKTQYTAIRLSNILGSDGSVIPLFRKQIENGGPVTVTHPDATRYFLPLRPAVMLILQAISMSQGGEIFSITYGKPLRIMNLAEYMIESAGLKPHDEIQIKVMGLRAGEKLYEEMLPDHKFVEETANKNIVTIITDEPNAEDFDTKLAILKDSLAHEGNAQIKRDLEGLVSEYGTRF